MNVFAPAAAFALRAAAAGPTPVPTPRLVGLGPRLETALQSAVHRAWTVLEVSLAGGPLWRRHARAADEPLREYLRAHLEAGRGVDRRAALTQLRAARAGGDLLGTGAGVGPAAQLARGYAPPADPAEYERALVAQIEAGLRRDYPALAGAAAAAPDGGTPLLAVAVRHFFRRELADDPELGLRLPLPRGGELSSGEEAALDALARNADRVLAAAAEALAAAPAGNTPRSGISGPPSSRVLPRPPLPAPAAAEAPCEPLPVKAGSPAAAIIAAMETLAQRYAPPAVCGDAGRAEVCRVLDLFRALPAAERLAPYRLVNAGELALLAGAVASAGRFFRDVPATSAPPAERAAAQHGHFRALLALGDYPEALAPYLEAVKLHPHRFAAFPVGEYVPAQVLAHGPGGVDFLCSHYEMGGDWVVRVLPPDPAGKAGQVAAEALRRAGHAAVPGVIDVGRVGSTGDRKTYVVFDRFAGATLADYVRQHGPFGLSDGFEVLREVAGGLAAAHAKGLVHGALDASTVLVRNGADGWAARVTEFPPSLRGPSAAAAPDYRPPEGSPSKAADVYGWGKLACFALFGAPLPPPGDWQRAPADVAALLRRCTAHDPRARPKGLNEVLDALERRAGAPR